MQKELFVSDIKRSIGLVAESSFLILEKDEKITRNGKPYLVLTLRDRTGDVSAKVWSDSLDHVGDVSVGDIVHVSFEVSEYREKADLVVSGMTKLTNYNEEDYRLSRDDINVEQLEQELKKWVDAVRDFNLQKLLRAFFDDDEFYKLYITYPAGERIHHEYRHGLLKHSIEVAVIADSLYQLHSDMNRDMMITGALLHDIGKLYEYTEDNVGAIGWTVEGRMFGHVVLGWLEIQKRISHEMSANLVNKLGNIVLSHQGKLEFGSPVVPRTREAMAIAFADKASMDLDIAKSMHRDTEDDAEYTEYNRYLGTDLYVG